MWSSDVVVIGAGAIGVSIALELARRGAEVTVLERGAAPAAGCSAGNAGVVGATFVFPLAGPDAVREGLQLMLRRHGAFTLRPRPSTLPWLARFLLASRPARERAGAAVLQDLARESAALHAELGARLDTGYAARGMLSVFETAVDTGHAAQPVELLDGPAARAALPWLGVPVAGAIRSPDAHCDPERYVAALAGELGTRIVTGVEVLRVTPGRPWTTAGDLHAREVVLATGAWSPALAPGLPVLGGKGYHVDYDAGPEDPELTVYFPEHRVVLTPMPGRLRISGMLELVGTDLRVDRRRVDAIVAHARRLFPALAGRRVQRVWRGLRPCTPDGLPIIGRAAPGLTLATGHGMWGLQLAPVTGRLVADLLEGRTEELASLRPQRFRVMSRSSR